VSRRPCANPTTPGDTNCPFFSEAHLCANFAEPLLEALTDTGTTIKREVQVRHIGVSSRDRVDYVVWINGQPIPVEVKQNVLADAIDTRDPTGIVLIATGSYLGEGFDWPELDTLILAFPLAFKGRVVQYVGRLLRTHEGKHDVELHDYVDRRIPVLDRMHTKRHPAYAILGFDVPKTRRRHTPPRVTPGSRTDAK
jgi:hypothetical protein